MKTGIFGGAFNPPHTGHVRVAQAAVKGLNLDRLLIVPTAKPPHKSIDPLFDDRKRLALTRIGFCCPVPEEAARIALEAEFFGRESGAEKEFQAIYSGDYDEIHDERFEVSPVELERPNDMKSYTVDTIRELQAASPGDSFCLIVGADQAAQFDTWKEWQAILERVQVAVARREGSDTREIASRFPQFLFFDSPLVPVSSTEIRARIHDRAPVAGMVTRSVEYLISIAF